MGTSKSPKARHHRHVPVACTQVYVIYAVAVAEPGHGNVGPLVMGITLWIATEAGGHASAIVAVNLLSFRLLCS